MWPVTAQGLQQLSLVALWVATISGAVAAGAGFLSTVSSNRAGNMVQADADKRIADADARGHEALARVAEADRGLGEANAKIAEQQAKAAQFAKEAAEARLAAERLKNAIAWRALSPSEVSALIVRASKNPQAVNLRYTDGDPEALALAIQFANAFHKANWQVGMGASKLPNALAVGLIVDTSQQAQNLLSLLRDCQIPFTDAQIPRGLEFNVLHVDGPTLLIGSKPR